MFDVLHWVQGLPAWNILLLARRPFAISVHDCSAVPAVVHSANAKVHDPHLVSVLRLLWALATGPISAVRSLTFVYVSMKRVEPT